MIRDLRIKTDTSQVDRVLTALEHLLEPRSLERFISSRVRPYLAERAAARFRAQGDNRVGGKWKKLADYTKDDREQRGYPRSRPINIRTHELERFITQSPGTLGVVADGAQLMLPGNGGSDRARRKFVVAQQGLSPNPIPGFRDVPARGVLGINDTDGRKLTMDLQRYIEAGLVTHG